jgi:hypothetical protein
MQLFQGGTEYSHDRMSCAQVGQGAGVESLREALLMRPVSFRALLCDHGPKDVPEDCSASDAP